MIGAYVNLNLQSRSLCGVGPVNVALGEIWQKH